MAQFSFKRHHDANILNDKHVVCTVKCWRHGCNHVVFNVKLGHAALILNRLLRLCLCLCLCSEFAKSYYYYYIIIIIVIIIVIDALDLKNGNAHAREWWKKCLLEFEYECSFTFYTLGWITLPSFRNYKGHKHRRVRRGTRSKVRKWNLLFMYIKCWFNPIFVVKWLENFKHSSVKFKNNPK